MKSQKIEITIVITVTAIICLTLLALFGKISLRLIKEGDCYGNIR